MVFKIECGHPVVQPWLEPKWQSVQMPHVGDVYGSMFTDDVNSYQRMIVCTQGLPTRQTNTFG